MVEQEQLPITRLQGAVITSFGLNEDETKKHFDWVGITPDEVQIKEALESLASEGFLVKDGEVYNLTDEGRVLKTRAGIAFLKED